MLEVLDPPGLRLGRALAWERAGETDAARAEMAALMTQCPDWDEPALRLAESLRHGGEGTAAEALYAQALERNPRRVEALLSLAALMMGRGAAEPAQMLLLRACALAPVSAEAWDALGVSLMLTRDEAAAEAAFAEAQKFAANDTGIALRRVEAARAAGALDGALARLEADLAGDPANAALLLGLGVALGHAGRMEEGIGCLEAAAALAPEDALAATVLANGLVQSGRLRPALAALDRAIDLAPEDAGLRNNRAATLVRLHRFAEARTALEALIAEHGEQPGFLCNLSNAVNSLGLQAEGVAHASRAVELHPGLHLARRTLCNALAYHPAVTGAAMLEAGRAASAALPRAEPVRWANTPDPERRLRVGLLSATLKTHPVGWLTLPGIENLDPDGFAVICLGQSPSDDVMQRRFQRAAAEWHVVEREERAGLAARLRALDLDILIDLGGYGDLGLMAVCAERVAPVQVKWVGMQNHSTGLAEMDWFITDRWETPPGFERFYSEKLMRLPDGYVCYAPPAYAPEVAPLPALARGAVTFGCFNNLVKITPDVLAAWSRILARVPDSRLVLKAHQFADAEVCARIRGSFAEAGIAGARIDLRGGSPHRTLLAEYNDIDIVLDPFPYGGGLTTCEALWMGVPTVTVPGETFASRHSTSHMSNAGLADWVAADLDGYVNMAVRRAADIPALAVLRAGLRAQVRASPLCDGPRFGRHLGAALRGAWRNWCAEQVA